MAMKDDIKEVLISHEEIQSICKRLGEQITKDYADKNLLVVSVLKGAVVFLSDLIRNIDCKCKIDFMAVSSYYGGTKTSGVVKFKKDLDINPEGYDILVVEDILDSGLSLRYLCDILKTRNANSLKICAFLDKPENRKTEISADYVGAVVPNEFVVGYGLDYAEEYRNLPYVGILKPEVYSN